MACCAQSLECYHGESHLGDKPVGYGTCMNAQFGPVQYCVKATRMHNVLRTCDDLHFCEVMMTPCLYCPRKAL
ncbi:unnamed protein product [Enterobius vermicularis]|uniref:ShKT domain-containing protein n=1 Tax=Enterobius vermicularis TaxID=51028 RepID=A0A0N4V770_ENTVE|nr:unnamed protein product [Enterobius vermicularis]